MDQHKNWIFYFKYDSKYYSYTLEFEIPKDEIKELYICGSWDQWKCPLKFECQDYGYIYRYSIKLKFIAPYYNYKFKYLGKDGEKWFNYLQNKIRYNRNFIGFDRDNDIIRFEHPYTKVIKQIGYPYNINFVNNTFNSDLVDKYKLNPFTVSSLNDICFRYVDHNKSYLDLHRYSLPYPLKEQLRLIEYKFDTFKQHCSKHFEYCNYYQVDHDNVNIDDFEYYTQFNWETFDYPLSAFFYNEGEWRCHTIINRSFPDIDIDILLNPLDFKQIYYVQEGINDGEPWIFLVQHENGFFIYFKASCDYSGFGCGEIIYDNDWSIMWNYGLDAFMRYKLLLHQLTFYKS